MEVISDEIKTVTRSQNSIPFNVNFDSLLEKYKEQGIFKLFYKHNFSISLEDGTNYPAYIAIFHEKSSQNWDTDQVGFTVVIENKELKIANLNVDFQLTINEQFSEFETMAGGTFTTAVYYEVYGIMHYFQNIANGWFDDIEPLKSVKGKMIFEFESKPTFQTEFIQRLGLNLVAPGERENFTIICQDQKIKFEKQLLINISPVFREMLESSWTKESKNGCIEVKEVKPETLLAFKNLLINGNDFKKEDLNIEIMIFADRYNITALLDLCGKYIASFAVNDENIFEFIQGIYLIKNGSYMNKATLLMKKNYEALKQDPRWKEFRKEHPECVFKMLDLFAKK